jgi:hypothetical protein
MKSVMFSKTAAALAVALTVTTLTLPSVVYADGNPIGRLFNKFDVFNSGNILATAIDPKTGEERSYTIFHFPKEQYNNKAALEVALKEAVLEKIAAEATQADIDRQEAELEVRKEAYMTRAKSVNKVTVDPKTGAWNFEYLHSAYDIEDINGYDKVSFRKRTFYPPNFIEPVVKSMVKPTSNGEFEYTYSVANGKNAKQFIEKIFVSSNINLTVTPIPVTGQDARWFDQQHKACKPRISSPKNVISLIFCNSDKGIDYQWYTVGTDAKTGESKQSGIYPGQRWDNLRLTVPHLPSVLPMHLEGFNDNDFAPQAILDVESPAKDKLEQLLNTIGKEVPVIAPQIAIPKPYSGAELARRIKADMQAWIVKKPGYELQTGNELITPTTLAALNRQFDLLIPALERKDKAAVRGIAKEMLTQIFTPHTDLDHYKFIADDEIHNTKPKRNLIISADATVKNTAIMEPLHRVAARALGFNLMYLITQSEKGR